MQRSAPADATQATADVFVSYSRSDRAFAAMLERQLRADGIDVWIDLSVIPPAADWRANILAGIEEATAFLFVMTPDSLASPVCLEELDHAVSLNKRIVPLLHRPVKRTDVPDAVGKLNWISYQDSDQDNAAVEALATAIRTDLVWLQSHARLTVRSQEWEARNRDRSLLLSGNDLRGAEEWLAKQGEHDQRATPSQVEYIVASRRSATRRQRTAFGAVTIALTVALVLAGAALIQWKEADAQRNRAERETATAREQAQLALSRQLSSDAVALPPDRYATALLLAAHAYDARNTYEARKALVILTDALPWLVTYLSHADATESTYATADGRLAVSETEGVRAWNVSERTAGPQLPLNDSYVDLDMTRDGDLVAAASRREVTIVDVEPQVRVRQTVSAEKDITDIAFDRDGSMLAIASRHRVVIWDLQRNAIKRRLRSPVKAASEPFDITDLTFSADGAALALSAPSSSDPGEIYIFDLTRQSAPEPLQELSGVVDLKFSPTDPHLLAAQDNFETKLVDIRTGQQVGRSLPGRLNMYVVAFSEDGSLLAAGGDEGFVIWSVDTQQELPGSWSLPLQVSNLFFDSRESSLVVSGADGTIVWDPHTTSRHSATFDARIGGAWAASYTADGQMLAVAGEGGIALWNVTTATPSLERTLAANTVPVADIAFSRDKRLLAASDETGIVVWDVQTGQRLGEPLAYKSLETSEAPFSLSFSPDGRLIAAGYDRHVVVWNVADGHMAGEPLQYSDGSSHVEAVTFNREGSLLAAGGDDGVALWSLPGRRPVFDRLAHPSDLSDVEFSADGELLVGAGRSESVLWNPATGRRIGPVITTDHDVVSADFSPDGRLVALAGVDGVTIWDVRSRRPLPSREMLATGNGPLASSVKFTPDGKQLTHVGGTSTVTTWDVSPASWRHLACRIANRRITRDEWSEFVGPSWPYDPVCRDTS